MQKAFYYHEEREVTANNLAWRLSKTWELPNAPADIFLWSYMFLD